MLGEEADEPRKQAVCYVSHTGGLQPGSELGDRVNRIGKNRQQREK